MVAHRPPGLLPPGVTLQDVKARITWWRSLPATGRTLTDQDLRMVLREFNHAQAVQGDRAGPSGACRRAES